MLRFPTVLTAVLVAGLLGDSAEGQDAGLRPAGAPPAAQLVEQVLAGNYEGSYRAVRWAVERCAAESQWHAAVLEALFSLEPSTWTVSWFAQDGLGRVWLSCGDERIRSWVDRAWRVELEPEAFRPLLVLSRQTDRLAAVFASGSEVVLDPPDLSLALEVHVESLPIEARPPFLADRFLAAGLAADYLAKWVPLYLAHRETADSMALLLMEALESNPGLPQAEAALTLLAPLVNAYWYRYSTEVRQRLPQTLQTLENGPLGHVVLGLREALDMSRGPDGRRIEFSDWQPEFVERDGQCFVVLPANVSAVSGGSPQLPLWSPEACPSPDDMALGDFDGDGSLDGAFKTSTGSVVMVLRGKPRPMLVLSDDGAGLAVDVSGPSSFFGGCYDFVPDLNVRYHDAVVLEAFGFAVEYFVDQDELVTWANDCH